MGDGIGSSEKKIGTASTNDECAHLVRAQEPKANGATRSQGTPPSSCYAEFGATGPDGNDNYQTCLFTGKLKLVHW